jgi:hypothetical protein
MKIKIIISSINDQIADEIKTGLFGKQSILLTKNNLPINTLALKLNQTS